MKRLLVLLIFCFTTLLASAQDPTTWLATLPQAKDYVQHRVSSYDRSGGNADSRMIAPGETLTLLDESGPGLISHIWITIATDDPNHLKALVLRMYWDGESTPSVELPSAISLDSAWETTSFISLFRCLSDPTRL